jgi:hypothetical protein
MVIDVSLVSDAYGTRRCSQCGRNAEMRGMHRAPVRRARITRRVAGPRSVARLLATLTVLAISAVGIAVVGGSAQAQESSPTTHRDPDVAICHATNSNTNPYVRTAADVDSIVRQHGHGDHDGPLWNPNLNAQHTKWGDVVPAFDYGRKRFDGLNWTDAGQAILANGCRIPAVAAMPVLGQSVCVGDPAAPSAPRLTLPADGNAVTYRVSKPGPYLPGQKLTVTATAGKPYAFASPAPQGWHRVDAMTESYLVIFAAAPSCETAPAAPITIDAAQPSFNESVCDAGPTPGHYRIPTSDHVYYTVGADPTPVAAGDYQFQVGAMPATVSIHPHVTTRAYALAEVDPAKFTHHFVAAACTADDGPTTVTVVAPTFVEAACNGDVQTPATYTIPDAVGVAFRIDHEPVTGGPHSWPAGTRITVIAAADENPERTVAFTHDFAAAKPCHAPDAAAAVALPDPTYVDSVCASGAPTAVSYTLVAVQGVRYAVNGVAKDAGTYPGVLGSSITITAVPADGVSFGDGVTGIFEHTFTSPLPCLAVDAEVASRAPSLGVLAAVAQQAPARSLANTGAGPVRQELAWAAGLLIAGSSLLFAGRRRYRKQH